MRKFAGNILIILSIACIVATIAWILFGILNQPENPSEDNRTSFYAEVFFAGVLIILEVIVLMCG